MKFTKLEENLYCRIARLHEKIWNIKDVEAPNGKFPVSFKALRIIKYSFGDPDMTDEEAIYEIHVECEGDKLLMAILVMKLTEEQPNEDGDLIVS